MVPGERYDVIYLHDLGGSDQKASMESILARSGTCCLVIRTKSHRVSDFKTDMLIILRNIIF